MGKWYDNPTGAEEVGEYRDALPEGLRKGRGAGLNPGNRFEATRLFVAGEFVEQRLAEAAAERESEISNLKSQIADPHPGPHPGVAHPRKAGGTPAPPDPLPKTQTATQVIADKTHSIITHNDSPDIGFTWSINPYRGCEHGCIYCYARPGHEYLGFSCGLDFETKIMAKLDAPALLKRELASPKWTGEHLMMSGVTDCYQPVEADLRLTRGCLEVMAECRQPVSLTTKSRLIERDLDVLAELNRFGAVRVGISVTTLDRKLAARMEPRASSPADRLHAIARLAAAGIPVALIAAPIIPGLTDCELPALLKAGAAAGAHSAGYILVRLPYQVKALFLDWLAREFPDRAGHVESLIRQTHDGALYNAAWGVRHKGEGPVAENIHRVFKVFARRYGLDKRSTPLSSAHFRRPALDGQMPLFAGA